MSNRILPFAVVITLTIAASPVFAQQSCESLTSLHLSGATVTSAATVVAAPAHCEVKLTMRPTKDSEIKSAVWLPMAGWNGKYQQVGNGGWAGSISYRAMADPLAKGYATAATDDGHDGGVGATWAVIPKSSSISAIVPFMKRAFKPKQSSALSMAATRR